jgi:hypothetical protein
MDAEADCFCARIFSTIEALRDYVENTGDTLNPNMSAISQAP